MMRRRVLTVITARRALAAITATTIGAAALVMLGATSDHADAHPDPARDARPTQPAGTQVAVDAYPASTALITIWTASERPMFVRAGQTIMLPDRPMWVSVLARADATPEATAMCAIRIDGELVAADAIHTASGSIECEWPSPWVH